MDTTNLRLHVDVTGEGALAKLGKSAGGAEAAEVALADAAKETNQALAQQDAAAGQTAKGVADLTAKTVDLARAEEAAQRRIKEVVRSSLERQRATLSAAAATREATKAAQASGQSGGSGTASKDALGSSFAETQRELESLNDAMANQAQSLEDIGERREWVSDLYERGLLSFEDTEGHLKTLEKQERTLQKSIADHAREVQNLVRRYDPASAAIKKITEDEMRLDRALRSGSISAQQHAKAMAGVQVGRARWQAESQGIQETAKQLNVLAFSSSGAFQDYSTMVQALGRGDFSTAGRQVLQLGARTNALRLLFSPLGAAATAAAVTIGAYTYATAQAQKETFEFSKALIFSGNAAGVTKDQLRQMAEEMDGIGGTQRAASEALTALAASGQVAGENLQDFATLAEQLRSKVGKPIADTVREFEELGRNPVEASKKLQQQYGYLTIGVLRQIKALQEQGRFQEAVNLAQETFFESQSQRIGEAAADVGYLQSAWTGVKKAVAGAADALVGIGRTDSLAKQIADTEALIQQISAGRPDDGATAQLREQIAVLRKRQETEEKAAREHAKAAADRKRETDDAIRGENRLTDVIAARFEATKQAVQAQFGNGAASVQRALSETLSQYSAYGSTLDALRSADLIKEEAYYAEKRKLIEQNRDARLKAVQDEIAAARQEQAFVRAAAASDENRQVGPDKEPERIRIRADAQQKELAIQARIKDKEAEVADIRRQSTAEVLNQSIAQLGAKESILEQLRQETREYELQATAGAHAAEAIERLRLGKAAEKTGIPGAKDDVNAAIDARDVAKDDAILAASEDELRLLRLGNEERRLEQASRALSAAATTEQVQALADNIKAMERADLFNAQLESMKEEFDAFSEDYVMTYKEMYDEVDARVAEHTLTEANAAKARILIAKAEARTKRAAAQELFGGLSSLMATENRKLFNIGKAAAIANATVTAGQAIMNAYATKPWYLGLALGISAAATLYSQISQLKNIQPGFMRGGFTGNQPIDQVAGVVHGQEFVMNAAATSRIGARNLDALQQGSATVLPGRGLAANSSHIGVPNVTIVDQSTGKKDWDVEMMEGRMQIIARDAADRAVATQTPKLVAGQINDTNSPISTALNRNIQAPRRRL